MNERFEKIAGIAAFVSGLFLFIALFGWLDEPPAPVEEKKSPVTETTVDPCSPSKETVTPTLDKNTQG